MGICPSPEQEEEAMKKKPLVNTKVTIRAVDCANVGTFNFVTDTSGRLSANLCPGLYELEAHTTSQVHDSATLQFNITEEETEKLLHVHFYKNAIACTIPCAPPGC